MSEKDDEEGKVENSIECVLNLLGGTKRAEEKEWRVSELRKENKQRGSSGRNSF